VEKIRLRTPLLHSAQLHQRCAGVGVQESTPAVVNVFQQKRSKTRSRYFWLEQKPDQEWQELNRSRSR